MSIRTTFNPLGTLGGSTPPAPPIPPTPGSVYEDRTLGELNTIPAAVMFAYSIYYDADFPVPGTLQATHIVLRNIITETPGTYVGCLPALYNYPLDYEFKREELMLLAEQPSPEAGELTNVVCTLFGGTLAPVEIGPGLGTIEYPLPRPGVGEQCQISEFSKKIVDGEELFVWKGSLASLNAQAGYLNPILKTVKEETTAPDGKQHVRMKAHMYANYPCSFGTRYIITTK